MAGVGRVNQKTSIQQADFGVAVQDQYQLLRHVDLCTGHGKQHSARGDVSEHDQTIRAVVLLPERPETVETKPLGILLRNVLPGRSRADPAAVIRPSETVDVYPDMVGPSTPELIRPCSLLKLQVANRL